MADEKKKYYQTTIVLPKESKEIIDKLVAETGLSKSRVFTTAVEEKYGIVLHSEDEK
jgi:predicted DNA-binding protein